MYTLFVHDLLIYLNATRNALTKPKIKQTNTNAESYTHSTPHWICCINNLVGGINLCAKEYCAYEYNKRNTQS